MELDLQRIRDKSALSENEYNHIWLGGYNDEIKGSIIKPIWFDAAIDAHKKLGITPSGQKMLTHDPSDTGTDPAAYCVNHGVLILECNEYDKKDVNENFDVATSAAVSHQVDAFRWDGGGLGSGLRREASNAFRGKNVKVEMFLGQDSVVEPEEIYKDFFNLSNQKTNKETFTNKRAQFYAELADAFYRTYRAVEKGEYINPDELISISSSIDDIEGLRAEVCRIPRKNNKTGKVQIMSKDEMRQELKLPSPNRADCLMMSRFPPLMGCGWDSLDYGDMGEYA